MQKKKHPHPHPNKNKIESTAKKAVISNACCSDDNIRIYDSSWGIDGYIPMWSDGYGDFSKHSILSKAIQSLTSSPTHAACVKSKATYCIGDGFNLSEANPSIFGKLRKVITGSEIKRKWVKQAGEIIKVANPEGESLSKVTSKLFMDFFSIGNAYVLLKKVTILGTSRTYCYHLDASRCRIGVEKKTKIPQYIGYANNWTGNEKPIKYGLSPYWTDESGNIAKDDMVMYSVIHIKDYLIGNYYYGLPDSISSLVAQEIEAEIGRYNLDEFHCGFTPNTIIQGSINAGQDELNAQAKRIKEAFTRSEGRKRTERIFTQLTADPNAILKIDTFGSENHEGKFTEQTQIAAEQIITAHRWSSVLAGIQTSGKLGTSSEIKSELLLRYSTVIKPTQRIVESEFLAKYAEANNVSEISIGISNSIPVSFMGILAIGDVLTVNEQRDELGYEPIPEGDRLISTTPTEKMNGTNNTAASNKVLTLGRAS